jgi:hypothetical protein
MTDRNDIILGFGSKARVFAIIGSNVLADRSIDLSPMTTVAAATVAAADGRDWHLSTGARNVPVHVPCHVRVMDLNAWTGSTRG